MTRDLGASVPRRRQRRRRHPRAGLTPRRRSLRAHRQLRAGERPLAPLGADGSDRHCERRRDHRDDRLAEPALSVARVEVSEFNDGTVSVDIDVDWADTDDEEG